MSSSIKPEKNTIHFWRGVVDPRNLTKIQPGQKVDEKLLKKVEKVQEALTQLVNNDHSHGANVEKLRNYNIYSVRLNGSDRILFTDIKVQGKNCLLLLDVVFDHNYAGSKFLKPGGLQKFYIRNSEAIEDENLDVENLPWEDADELPKFDSEGHTVDVDYAAVDYYKSKFILFDDVQGKALAAKLPVIVNGPPGSGKTCVALSALINYMSRGGNQKDKRILYVCASEKLAASMQRKWNEHPLSKLEGKNRTVVEFKSYDAMILSMNDEVRSHIQASDDDKSQWLKRELDEINRRRNNANFKGRKQKGKRSQAALKIGDKSAIFDEFLVLSTCRDLKEYQTIGKKKRHFHTQDEQETVWQLFHAYNKWLQHEHKYDSKFCKLSQKDLYDLTVVDESADFSPDAMMELFRLTKDQQIAFFLDTQQDLEDSLSKRNMLKALMRKHGVEIDSMNLPSVYRCPQAVVDFANRCLDLKAYLLGGISDKEEYRKVQAASKENNENGECVWKEENIDEVYSQLKLEHNEADIAFITSTKHKQALSDAVDHPLIFTPEEIKGLEYPVIVLYEPFDTEEYGAIDAKLGDTEQEDLKGNHHRAKTDVEQNMKSKVAPLMSKLFTSVTRAEEKLVICQKVKHGIKHIHRLLWGKEKSQEAHIEKTQAPVSKPVDSSTVDWLKRAKELYLEEKLEQFNQVCRTRLKKDPEEVIRELGLEPHQKEEEKESHLQVSSIPIDDVDVIENKDEGSSSSVTAPSKGKNRKKKQAQRKQPNSSPAAPSASSSKNVGIDKKIIKNIFRAAGKGQLSKVQEILRQGVPIDIEDHHSGQSLLAHALAKSQGDMAEYLISQGANINIKSKTGIPLVHLTIRSRSLSTVKFLMEQQPDLEIRDLDGRTALIYAADIGNLEAMKFLVEAGEDMNAQDNKDRTALHILTDPSRNLSIADKDTLTPFVNLLIENGADLAIQDGEGSTALSYLIRSNWVEASIFKTEEDKDQESSNISPISRYMTQMRAAVDIPDHYGRTPLHYAAMDEDDDDFYLEPLLRCGADLNIRDNCGYNPLHLATRLNKGVFVDLLVEAGAETHTVNNRCNTVIHTAASKGYDELVAYFIEKGCYLNGFNDKLKTPLHLAAEKGYVNVVRLLIDNDANLETKDEKGKTALMLALANSHLGIVKMIAEELSERTNIVKLHDAIRKVDIDKVREFLSNKNLVNRKNDVGDTCLYIACQIFDRDQEEKKYYLIKLLLENGAEVNHKNTVGLTPLHFASVCEMNKEYQEKIINLLLEYGADINLRNNKGETALFMSIIYRNTFSPLKLLQCEADPNIGDKKGATPLHLETENHFNFAKSKNFENLIEFGADIDSRDCQGKTPLHYAAKCGNLQAAKVLIKKGAKVDVLDDDDNTPLVLASIRYTKKFNKAKHFEAQRYKDICDLILESFDMPSSSST